MQNSEFRECFKCYYQAVTQETACPRCRKPLYTSSSIRKRGIVLVFIGLFLVVLMGAVAVGVTIFLAGSIKDPQSAAKINAESGTLLAIYGIFAAVIVFGLHSMLIGAWQIIFGKRNRVFIWIMWALLAVIFISGGIFRASFV